MTLCTPPRPSLTLAPLLVPLWPWNPSLPPSDLGTPPCPHLTLAPLLVPLWPWNPSLPPSDLGTPPRPSLTLEPLLAPIWPSHPSLVKVPYRHTSTPQAMIWITCLNLVRGRRGGEHRNFTKIGTFNNITTFEYSDVDLFHIVSGYNIVFLMQCAVIYYFRLSRIYRERNTI